MYLFVFCISCYFICESCEFSVSCADFVSFIYIFFQFQIKTPSSYSVNYPGSLTNYPFFTSQTSPKQMGGDHTYDILSCGCIIDKFDSDYGNHWTKTEFRCTVCEETRQKLKEKLDASLAEEQKAYRSHPTNDRVASLFRIQHDMLQQKDPKASYRVFCQEKVWCACCNKHISLNMLDRHKQSRTHKKKLPVIDHKTRDTWAFVDTLNNISREIIVQKGSRPGQQLGCVLGNKSKEKNVPSFLEQGKKRQRHKDDDKRRQQKKDRKSMASLDNK